MARLMAAAAALLLVSGCADVHTDFYQRLQKVGADGVAIDETGACTLAGRIKDIPDDADIAAKTPLALNNEVLMLRCDRDFLVNRADNAKAISDQFNVPVIGLAVGAGAALLYRSSIDVPAGIGLAAGGLAGLDAYFQPEKNVDIYLKAASALDCGVIAGQTVAAARYQNLVRARRALLADIATAGTHPARSSASAKNLSDAVAAANQALTAADAEFDALDNSPFALAKLRSQVRFSVMKNTERQAVDFATQRQSVIAALQASTESTSNARDARSKLFEAQANQSQQPKDNVTKPADPDEVREANAAIAGAGAAAPSGQPGTAMPSNAPDADTASVIARLIWDVQWVQNVTPNPSYTAEAAAISACGLGL